MQGDCAPQLYILMISHFKGFLLKPESHYSCHMLYGFVAIAESDLLDKSLCERDFRGGVEVGYIHEDPERKTRLTTMWMCFSWVSWFPEFIFP